MGKNINTNYKYKHYAPKSPVQKAQKGEGIIGRAPTTPEPEPRQQIP
jgi:hypothetical protein